MDLVGNLWELLEPVIHVAWNVNPNTQEKTRFVVTLLGGVASTTTLAASTYGFVKWLRRDGNTTGGGKGPALDAATRREALRLRRQGRAELARGELEVAIHTLTRALELTPKSIDALNSRAQAHARRNDFAAAVSDLNASDSVTQGQFVVYLQRAKAKEGLGDLGGAVHDLRLALRLRPDHAEARQVLRRLQPTIAECVAA